MLQLARGLQGKPILQAAGHGCSEQALLVDIGLMHVQPVTWNAGMRQPCAAHSKKDTLCQLSQKSMEVCSALNSRSSNDMSPSNNSLAASRALLC